jgi:hypothetical protein
MISLGNKCQYLVALDISHCKAVTDEGISFFFSGFKGNLTKLDISGCELCSNESITTIGQYGMKDMIDFKANSIPGVLQSGLEIMFQNARNLESFEIKDISNFIGMPLQHNEDLKQVLKKYNINYAVYGGTFDKNSERNKSIEENMKLIQESIIAPALQTEWQIEKNYIPCRIFKNISYGKMGITNSEAVYELFNKKIIYSSNIDELVKKSLEFNKNKDRFNIIKELMIEVRDNHTYINRINFILGFLNLDIKK